MTQGLIRRVSTLVVVGIAVGCGLYKNPNARLGVTAAVQIKDSALNLKAMALLSNHCTSCHSNTASLDGMVGAGWVIPGNAANSLLYQRIQNGSMPPGSPFSAADQQTIHDWIQDGMALAAPIVPVGPPAGTSVLGGQAFAILQSRCAACHGPGSRADGGIGYILDFQKLIDMGLTIPGNASGSPLYMSISAGRMPPGAPLSAVDAKTIFDWIQTDLKSGVPQPMPSVIPLTKTYSSISANILVPKCVACHGSSVAKEGVRYDTYLSTLRSVVKGNPAGSKLYTITRSGSMPPGSGDLNAAELKAIFDWITDGAPNN